MKRLLMLAILLAILAIPAASGAPALAAPQQSDASARAAGVTDWSAQSRPRRARPQLRISPRYPYRRFHSVYPLPYTYEYPGPNAVRQCVDRYAVEHRPSGTVIVPRMRCWWVPG